jgi:16S rRNA (guanine966-N2)-methyltransferase
MYIISGKYQRQSIKYPTNRAFRPTKSIVREAIFNILAHKVYGSSFLDLCSGSGAIGLEAESRGAHSVVCVDRDITYLAKNKRLLNASIHIVRSDIVTYLKRISEQFDIIYLDPVWADQSVYHESLSFILNRGLLATNGWLIIEHDQLFKIQQDSFDISEYKYGNSKITILKQ